MYELSSSHDKNRKGRKKARKKRRHHAYQLQELIDFIALLRDSELPKSIKIIRGKSKKFLRKCSKQIKFSSLTEAKRKLVFDWIELLSKTKTIVTHQDRKLYFEVNFIHKLVQPVNLRRIMGEKSVKDKMPDNQFAYIPNFYYKYGRNIGQTILNYNQTSRELSCSNFAELESMP